MRGLRPCFLASRHEIHRAEEVAVVGEGDGLLTQFLRALAQDVHAAAPVEQAEVGVDVKVDEFVVGGSHGRTLRRGTPGGKCELFTRAGQLFCWRAR